MRPIIAILFLALLFAIPVDASECSGGSCGPIRSIIQHGPVQKLVKAKPVRRGLARLLPRNR